ncbi:AbrB/MazE/SpoVT family DNA-binding domain-containing protein [Pseudomonas sp. p106]|nr:AbrB/MazE/SpoVT family DNA-binding domain-containing protein [Pseudomonas sp. p106]
MGDSFQTIVICQDPGDGSRDVIINLTPDVLAAMNARLGDTFSIELVNGSIVLKPIRDAGTRS